MGGDVVARRVETGRARLAQRDNRERRKPFRAPRDWEGERKRVDGKPGKAHTRERATRTVWASAGVDLKVSRAAEKLAHLISNGSFNNSPRRPFPRISAPAMRALTVLYFRDAPDSLRPPDQPRDKNVSCSFRRRLSNVLLPAPWVVGYVYESWRGGLDGYVEKNGGDARRS